MPSNEIHGTIKGGVAHLELLYPVLINLKVWKSRTYCTTSNSNLETHQTMLFLQGLNYTPLPHVSYSKLAINNQVMLHITMLSYVMTNNFYFSLRIYTKMYERTA